MRYRPCGKYAIAPDDAVAAASTHFCIAGAESALTWPSASPDVGSAPNSTTQSNTRVGIGQLDLRNVEFEEMPLGG